MPKSVPNKMKADSAYPEVTVFLIFGDISHQKVTSLNETLNVYVQLKYI